MVPFISDLSLSAAIIAGLIAGLSPCTLPTAALLVGYVGGSGEDSRLRCFFLTISFVLGLSLTLAVFGLIASGVGIALQSLSFIYKILGVLIIVMGLVIADILPLNLSIGQNSLKIFGDRGGMIGAFLLGIPFALIASPCTIPITTAVLALVATKADLFFGFWFLLFYAMGRSLPLLLVGTFTGLLKSILKGQAILNGLQKFSALVLIGLGVYFIFFV
ncbi:MAG: cytochrome c biogenesis protein CcdA [Desulfotomaculaceae bacterium]|nr:cytochrome c biogenesis protein CcdA [Desulfotomaculaceae bacterium]